MKILHLTLLKKWFDAIASGQKTEEYRDIKPYWTTRLVGKQFDEIHFRNGYAKNAPFMRVEWKGCKITRNHLGNISYGIQLGKILELRNNNPKNRN